jgi:putative ABC transport system ATP-binding protein
VDRSHAIIIENLVKIYRTGSLEVQALRGLNLSVNYGEIVAIIGPSGSGKSTLLNIIGGIDRATAGSINVMGEDLTELDPAQLVEFRRKNVGHLFQGVNLVPTLTAAENIDLPMAAIGAKRAERRRKVKELLGFFKLEGRMNHMPKELSGGELQRVAIATALANDPPLIVVDEPTGELDTENALIVIEYLVRASRELGKTVVMTTHDPRVARSADRIFGIRDGVITVGVKPNIGITKGDEDYSDYLKNRISAIGMNLDQLLQQFKKGEIDSETYLERHKSLKDTRTVLKEELRYLGHKKEKP